VSDAVIEPAGAESIDVVALAVPTDATWAVFVTEPVATASTVIVSVIVLAVWEKLKVHPTVPFWPDGGNVGQRPCGFMPALRNLTSAGRASVTE